MLKQVMLTPKQKASKIGRPKTTKDNIPFLFYKHYSAYTSGQLNISEFARVVGVSRTTIYKYISIIKQ